MKGGPACESLLETLKECLRDGLFDIDTGVGLVSESVSEGGRVSTLSVRRGVRNGITIPCKLARDSQVSSEQRSQRSISVSTKKMVSS